MPSSPAAVTPIADPTDALLVWASQTEIALTAPMADAEWCFEVGGRGLRFDELEKLEQFFGLFIARQVAAGGSVTDTIQLAPHLAAMTLASRAARMVDPESYFAEYVAGLGLEPAAAAEVAAVFESIMNAAGLQCPDAPAAVVAALHAGIVTDEIPDLIELLATVRTPEAAVKALADGSYVEALSPAAEAEDAEDAEGDEEAAAPRRPLALLRQQVAVAPEAMAALVQGVDALCAHSKDNPLAWADEECTGLPQTIAAAVTAELIERPVGTVGRRYAVGAATRERTPRIVFNAERGRICVRLPEHMLPEPSATITWRVRMGGTTKVYRAGKPWGEPNPLSAAIDVLVSKQVREVTVLNTTYGGQWVTPVVNADDPALLFTDRGQNLTDMQSLHHPRLVVVCPKDARVMDAVAGTELPIIDSGDVVGWTGWKSVTVDSSQARSVQVVQKGEEPSLAGAVRSVDTRRRVQFVHPEAPLPFVRSATRLPVHATSLVAEFPPTQSGEVETWYLSISSFAGAGNSGEEVAPAEPLEVPAEGGAFDVFDPEIYDAPWVGEYLVRLRGPRNESFRHEYAIVEGMSCDYDVAGLSQSFRIPAQGGLSTAKLSVRHGDKPFTVSQKTVHVAGDKPGAEFVVTTDEGDQMPLWFKPPRLRFEVPLVAQPPMWRTTRVTAAPRDFDHFGQLRVRAAGQMRDVKVSVRNHHGTPLHTSRMVAEDSTTSSTPMAPLASAMTTMVSGQIAVEWTDPKSDRRVSVTLADISMEPDAQGITADNQVDGAQEPDQPATLLTVQGRAERPLAAWMWPLSAPWAPGKTVPVEGNTIAVPQEFQGAGSLAVQLHSADPFSTLRAPLAPGAQAFTIAQPGFYQGINKELGELSAFFAGVSDEVPTGSQIMPLLWDFVSGWEGTRVRDAAIAALSAKPRSALTGLSASLVPNNLQPRQLVSSGLVHALFSGDEPATGHHRSAWISTLEKLADLPAILEASEESGQRQGLRAALGELADIAGKQLVGTLTTGREASLDTACIDATTVGIAGMAPAQQKAMLDLFFAQAQIVPGPFMEESGRLMAIFETFNRREELGALLADRNLIQAAVTLLRAMRGSNRSLYGSARVRFDRLDGVDTENPANLWALAPVISLVFALSARMNAHGLMGKTKILEEASAGWAALAELVPDLVIGDVVSAEAMVMSVKYPSFRG